MYRNRKKDLYMKQIIKKGDMFLFTDHFNNGKSYDIYCKLAYIEDYDSNRYDELEIVTGYGDKNTKAEYWLKPICDVNLKKIKEPLLHKMTNGLIKVNPHNAFHINIDEKIQRLEQKIDTIYDQINFFKQNHSLETKLKSLLEENI